MSMRGIPARKRGRPSKAAMLARGAALLGRATSGLGRGRGRGAKRGPYKKRYAVSSGQEDIDIGDQLIRWTILKEGINLASDEDLARQLLDFWDENVKKPRKDNGLPLGPATIADFESFQARTKRSADEIIRFFLRLDIEPGQSVIVVSDGVGRVFESLRSKMKIKSNELMTNLLEVHAKHTKWCGQDKQKPELEVSVRRAIHEEMISLVQEGILPAGPGAAMRLLGGVEAGDGGRAMYGVMDTREVWDQQAEESLAMISKDMLTGESSKKRSRKSLPQRVFLDRDGSETEDGVEVCVDTESQDGKASDSEVQGLPDDAEIMKYNYILSDSNSLTTTTVDTSTTDTNILTDQSQIDDPYAKVSEKDLDAQGMFRLGPYTVTRDINDQLGCPYCDYKTAGFLQLRRHFTLHTGKEFKCPMCERSYTNEYKLKEHFKVKHEQSVNFKCDLCPRNFTSKGGLRYHRRTMHHKDFNYWCEKCSKGFNQIMFYKAHMSKHGKATDFKCLNCKKEYLNSKALQLHSQTCRSGTSSGEIICTTCSARFASPADLEAHIATVHNGASRYRCGCGTEFQWRAKYDNHRATCSQSGIENGNADVKPDAADLHNIAIGNVESLPSTADGEEKGTNVDFDENSVQVTNMESGEQYFYDLTEEEDQAQRVGPAGPGPRKEAFLQANSTSMLDGTEVDNQGTGSGQGVEFACKFCSYRTGIKSHLRRHEMGHIKKRYKCEECGKAFAELARLRAHHTAKHQNPRHRTGLGGYKCDKCSRTFLSKGGIMYHQQTKHNNTYKYRCETCDKGFNTIQHYLGHKNTHSGIRPFVCDKCNLGFAYPSVLTSHKRVCKGKVDGVDMNGRLDLYPCKECKEKFAMFSALQEHVQEKHGKSGQQRFLCECGADFELRALYEHHKTTCNMSDRSVEMILQNMDAELESSENAAGQVVANSQDDDGVVSVDEEFKQLSPEKFNAIINTQPVFPL